jgi:hypothetical protein
MERINGFLGYRAITEIRIVQAPIVYRLGQAELGMTRPKPRQVISSSTSAASPLGNALERLAQSVAATSRAAGR